MLNRSTEGIFTAIVVFFLVHSILLCLCIRVILHLSTVIVIKAEDATKKVSGLKSNKDEVVSMFEVQSQDKYSVFLA